MPECVRINMRQTVLVRKLIKPVGNAFGVHRISDIAAVILNEQKFSSLAMLNAFTVCDLDEAAPLRACFSSEIKSICTIFPEQFHSFIGKLNAAVRIGGFGGILIYFELLRIKQIVIDMYRVAVEVNGTPFQAHYLATPTACHNKQVGDNFPFQRSLSRQSLMRSSSSGSK